MLTLIACCLVINEIAHAPADSRAEYVELFHTGSSRLLLSGATLYDERSVPRPISARPIEVEPGEYVVLVRDGEAFSRSFPGVPFLEVEGWPSLNNTGDRIAIALGSVELDAVAYETDWGQGPASLERRDPNGPSNHRVNWRPSASAGTPGRQNSRYAPDSEPPSLVYAEVFDPDSAFVVFSEPVFPATAAAFGGGEIAWQTDSSAILVRAPSLVAWSGQNSITLEARQVQDLFGNAAPTTSVAVARQPLPGEIVISERLARPLADPLDGLPDQTRFLELWNRSDALLSVRGLAVTGRVRDTGDGPSSTVPFAARAVSPGATVVLSDDPATLREAFLLDAYMDLRTVGADVLRESHVKLLGANGELLDESVYNPDWFDPVLGERGYSLSRTSIDGVSPLSWSTAFEGPNPGTHGTWETSPSPEPGGAVFTEVLFHARPGQAEFVEILVRERADLNGLHLLIDKAPALPDSVRIVYRPTTTPAGTLVTVVFQVSGLSAADVLPHFRLAYENVEGPLFPVLGSHSLRNDGVTMELRSGPGRVLDRVSLSPSLHAPDLTNVAGVSLERVDPDGPSWEGTNWVSARAAAGGTPGQPFSGGAFPDSEAETGSRPSLSVRPKVFDPSEGPVAIDLIAGEQTSASVQIFARSGRAVRRLSLQFAGGQGRVYWDGRDDAGRLLAPGVFIVFVRDSEGIPHKSLVVLAGR